ncbi:MAG: biotin-dependent carboxyltransferase [Chloroflexi bacterium]|nr:MAG: biotin-dependent carboxyltransferase [Chloroflexota bacterium]
MTAALRVRQPGLLTTIQDLGRPQAVGAGVTPGGAMDRFAHAAANLLVGNDRGAATLECTLTGPRLVALRQCLVAVTGADFDPRVNGEAVPTWTGIDLREGDEIGFAGRRTGARAYIAVAGGVVGDRWLGSMSTNLLAARGGMNGRALATDDVVSAAIQEYPDVAGRSLAGDQRPPYHEHLLHAVVGPHANRLTPASRHDLFSAKFTLTHDSNRMGYRFEGASLEAPGDELLSFALIPGAVQLPAGGRPILLMADHQTAGGYPVVAVVISASMPVAAQLAPGDEVRFEEVSIAKALELRAVQRAALLSLMS